MNKWADKEEFKSRVREWAEILEIEVKTISIRPMNNKWASYTQHNDLLIFNSDLLEMDKELGNYVIVHELLHFKVPNHGKLWKSLMKLHLGDYLELEKKLKVLAAETIID